MRILIFAVSLLPIYQEHPYSSSSQDTSCLNHCFLFEHCCFLMFATVCHNYRKGHPLLSISFHFMIQGQLLLLPNHNLSNFRNHNLFWPMKQPVYFHLLSVYDYPPSLSPYCYCQPDSCKNDWKVKMTIPSPNMVRYTYFKADGIFKI